jgi:outer membrane protein, heavy metal efflux system
MVSFSCRALRRARWAPQVAVALLLSGVVPPLAADVASDPPLGYQDAVSLALAEQPALSSLAAMADAARAQAVAAGELPDPSLSVGISEIPVNTDDRFSLTRDGDTDVMLGIRQEFPRAAKRQLRRARLNDEALVLDAERDDMARRIAEQTGLAWLDTWWAEGARTLTAATLAETERQHEALRIAFAAGQGSQSALLGIEVEIGRLRDRLDGLDQQQASARHRLSRWIGEAAYRPTSGAPPLEIDASVTALQERLTDHPHLLAKQARIHQAETDIALAKQDYRPDWALTVALGYRPAFSEMGTVMVEVPLPMFTAKRQDRRLEAAHAEAAARSAQLEDRLRLHRAHIREWATDAAALQARWQRYDTELLPLAQRRVAVTTAAYAAGKQPLEEVLEARRAVLALALEALDLQRDAAQRRIQLNYFAP